MVKSGRFVVLKMFAEVDVNRDGVVVDATVVLNVVVVILVVRLGEKVVIKISAELVVKIGTVDVVRMIPTVVAGANVVFVVVMVLVVVKEVVSI